MVPVQLSLQAGWELSRAVCSAASAKSFLHTFSRLKLSARKSVAECILLDALF